METTPTTIAVVIVLVILAGVLGVLLMRWQRTRRLKERFGPEYERVVNEVGDQRKAESELQDRLDRVRVLDIRSLSAEEIKRFSTDWKLAQAEFVDQPLPAVQKANRLIKEAMNARGYPVDDFEQRAADISVDYPDLVSDYRGLHAIAVRGEDQSPTTEELRQAMIHGKALFEKLVQPGEVTEPRQKERT